MISELLAVRFNGYRALTMLSRGQIPGPEAGLAKVTMVNAAIEATDLAADVLGPEALDSSSEWSYLISFLPGLKSAGGTESILRNTIGERVLGLPPEPRLDKGIPFSELRAKEKAGGDQMNFALTDEQEFLREAARGALSRHKTIEAARAALEDPSALPDLWPMAVEAGWPGLLIDEEHGGAGLEAFDALLVAEELRPRARVGPAARAAARDRDPQRGRRRVACRRSPPVSCAPAYVPARPPGDVEQSWTVQPRFGATRMPAPRPRSQTARRCSKGRSRSSPMRPVPACWSRSGAATAACRSPSRSPRTPTACRSRRSFRMTRPARSGT